jgi:agmatinase
MLRLVVALSALNCRFLHAREITFPPVSGYVPQYGPQQQMGASNGFRGTADDDVFPGMFSGLMTFANLPYVHCLRGGEEAELSDDERFDIAVIGAPFDTVCIFSPIGCLYYFRQSHI